MKWQSRVLLNILGGISKIVCGLMSGKSWKKIHKICIKIYLNSPISIMFRDWKNEWLKMRHTNRWQQWEKTCSHRLNFKCMRGECFCHRTPCMCINKRHHINLYLEAARHVILMLIAILSYTRIDIVIESRILIVVNVPSAPNSQIRSKHVVKAA